MNKTDQRNESNNEEQANDIIFQLDDDFEPEPTGRGKIEEGIRPSKPPVDPDPYTFSPEERQLIHVDHIPKELSLVKRVLEERTGLNSSFDAMMREMTYGGKKTGLFYLNGFAKDDVLTLIMSRLTYLTPRELKADVLQSFLELYVPHIQVDLVETMTEAIDNVHMGASALFIEGESKAIVIDAKTYPQRGPEEPSIERVVRGARDGFIETLLTNITLVRRRLRDPRLRLETVKVGRRSQTDVCIAYVQDIADTSLVQEIKKKIQELDVDAIVMADKELEEAVIGKGWNPFPAVRYTERPDVTAHHLVEGHICLFVDTSPSVIILPTTFFDHVQHAEESRQSPFVGTYLRWVRFFGIFASLFLLPLWFLFVLHPELKHPAIGFIGPQELGRVPIIAQFLIVEIGVDLMRLAAVHTPTPLATAMGLIAAILIGDIAIKAGLFINEVILYMAVAAIGMFATPSYELGLANRLVRIILLVLVALFGLPGFVAGTTLIILLLITQRSFRAPYLWPFIPFDAKEMLNVLVRRPFLSQKYRISLTKPQDRTRMPTKK